MLLGSYLGMGLIGDLLGYVAAHAAALPNWLGGREPWRVTMILCATTGPLLALLIMATRLERKGGIAPTGGAMADVISCLRQEARTLAGIFFGFGLSYAAFGAQAAWGPVIVRRRPICAYSKDRSVWTWSHARSGSTTPSGCGERSSLAAGSPSKP